MGHSRTAASALSASSMVLAGLIVLLSLGVSPARAQDFPTKPIRLIIGYAPGGGAGIPATLIQPSLSKYLGQPVVLDFKPGASSALAAGLLTKEKPDGYTLFLTSTAFTTFPARKTKFEFDVVKDFTPVSEIGDSPFIITVHPSSPINTVADLIAHAKANPGKLNYGTSGGFGSDFMLFEYFKLLAGISIVNVPYTGTAAVDTGVMSGTTELGMGGSPSFGLVRAGKLKGIAVTSASRAATLPNIPSLGETFPGFDGGFWIGIFAPKGTPPAIVRRLNEGLNHAIVQPEVQKGYVPLNMTAKPSSPEDFSRKVQASVKTWLDLVAKTGMVLE